MRTSESIKQFWLPKARASELLVKALAERSYQRFVNERHENLFSCYCGGTILIATFRVNGECWQHILHRSELDALPEEFNNIKAEFKRALSKPATPFLMQL